jgi:apolipoprotein N-acyltransferase
LLAAAASGLLLIAAFPPVDVGWLALVAPIPLLWAWRRSGPGAGALCGLLAGGVFFGGLCAWATNVGYVAYVPLVITMALWWTASGAAAGWLARRRLGSPLVLAALWTLVEFARGRVPFGGFTWGGIGYAYHDISFVRSLAPWGGVELLTFMSIVASAALLDVIASRRRIGRQHAAIVIAGVTVAAFLAHVVQPTLTATGLLRVAVLQGNDKNRRLTNDEIDDRYLVTSHLRLADHVRPPVDLLVFPESSLDADPRDDSQLETQLINVARAHRSALLVNANADAGDGRLFNTNFMFGSDGELLGTYAKRHLVPFGEYVPFRSHLRFIKELDQIPTDFAPGTGHRVFAVAGHRVATMICFESAFPPAARRYARDGADVIVVSTNNRSFRRSANAAQHVAMGQLRAAETGRPVVQAAISGISAFIDEKGAIHGRTRLFARTVLSGTVRGTKGLTPYDRIGSWPTGMAAAVLAFGVRRGLRRRVLGS